MDKKRRIPADLDGCSVRRTATGVEVEIVVRNDGERPILTTTGIRQLQLDETTGRLDLWFSDHGRDAGAMGGRCRIDSTPHTETVEPGTTRSFTARLRPTYTRVVAHADKSFHFELIDLQRARTLVAHIAVAEAPFYFNPKGRSMIKPLKEWGEARTISVAIPDQPAEGEKSEIAP